MLVHVEEGVICCMCFNREIKEVSRVSEGITKIEINCNIAHKIFGNNSRDETRRIGKNKGQVLTENWKVCLGCTSRKTKQSNLTNDFEHKVVEKLDESTW